MAQLHLPHTGVWDAFTHSHMSVLTLFLLYAVPMSVIPPVMIYYAGVTYGGQLFPVMSDLQLQTIGVLLFLTELAMTFVIAYVIQRMGDVIDIKPAFEDAYKLAVVAPTPLWLVPLFLFIPSVTVNLTAISAALMISGILIFRNVPSILRVEEKGHAILLAGSILAAGLVAWVVMMFLTLLTWSMITASPML